MRFANCRVEDGEELDEDADVEIDGPDILVSYFDSQGPVVLQGREAGPGRYEVTARSRPRKGELRRVGEDVLEGTWWEAGDRGTLRVTLGPADELATSG